MEDAHTTILDLEDAKGTAFFGVYDGHGGEPVILFDTKELFEIHLSFIWLNQDTALTPYIIPFLSCFFSLFYLSG